SILPSGEKAAVQTWPPSTCWRLTGRGSKFRGSSSGSGATAGLAAVAFLAGGACAVAQRDRSESARMTETAMPRTGVTEVNRRVLIISLLGVEPPFRRGLQTTIPRIRSYL